MIVSKTIDVCSIQAAPAKMKFNPIDHIEIVKQVKI